MIHKNISQFEKEKISAGKNTYKQVLIGPDSAPHFALRKFIIESGGEMPLHTNSVEHEQYILNGKAEVRIGDSVLTVQKDDVVFIPAGIEHSYKTIGNDAFEFLCAVPNLNDEIKLI